MKVKFKYGIRTYSGKLDDLVFCRCYNDTVCIARKYVYPRFSEQIVSISHNLATIWENGSSEFKAQLELYAKLNETENVPDDQWAPNSYTLWIEVMYNWAADNNVDLDSLTIEEFAVMGTAVRTVKNCVLNGYLKPVTGYDMMTAPF